MKTFVYPDAFEKFVKFEDDAIQNSVHEQIVEAQRITEELRIKAEEERLRNLAAQQSVAKVKNKTGKKLPPRKNLAFKLNYCDGGSCGTSVGFKGVCSEDVRAYNINVAKHSWCSNAACPCKKYMDGVITEQEFADLCNQNMVCDESITLEKWISHAGTDLNGENAGKPRRLPNAQLGSLAILTTRLPKEPEENRIIIGVFIVDAATEGDDDNEGSVSCKSKYHIEIRPNEVYKLRFWDYYVNEGNPESKKWGTGLYRFIKDEDALRLLEDIVALKEGTDEHDDAAEVLEYYKELHDIQ